MYRTSRFQFAAVIARTRQFAQFLRFTVYVVAAGASLGCTESTGPSQFNEWHFDSTDLVGQATTERPGRAPLDEEFLAWQQTLRGKLFDVFGIVDSSRDSLPTVVARHIDSVKALAFSSYGGGLGPFREIQGQETKRPHYCHIVPGSGKFMNQEDWLLLPVPRAVAGFRGDQSKDRGAVFSDAMLPYWESFGSPERFPFRNINNGRHVFFVERTLAFFRNNLQA